MEVKKILTLVPTSYSKRALGDIINFVPFYKDDLDVNILVKDLEQPIIEREGYKLVDVDSEYGRYLKIASDFVIDAGSLDNNLRKGNHQKWVSVWHGIPYKKMFAATQPPNHEDATKYGNAYDCMISSSPYYTNRFLRESMLYRKDIYELGSSRMDSMFNKSEEDIKLLKKKLNLPLDKKVILYAPTFRDEQLEKIGLPFNLANLLESISDEYVIAIKLHHFNNLIVDKKHSKKIINLEECENISEILLCSDILISDYSSLIFDYSVLKRPIILYQFDKESYSEKTGLYFDIDDFFTPESIVYKEEDLINIFKNNDFTNIKNTLAKTFYPYEDGQSTKRIVEKINFDITPRKTQEIIFVLNDLNEIGGVHSWVMNMARYYKTHYNTRISVIANKEFVTRNSEVYRFESEYVDFQLSKQNNRNAVRRILQNNSGTIISMQFSAHVALQGFMNGDCILMFHGDPQLLIDADFYSFQLKGINEQSIYNYKKMVVLSKNGENKLSTHLETKLQPYLTSIPNSIDLPFAYIEKNPNNNWAFIGRFSDEKNPFELIKLGNLIKEKKSDLIINIYGDGPLREEFEQSIKDNDLENILKVHGFVSDKNIIFENNNGLLMVSKNEGLPLVIPEAYSFGRPVVIYDTFTSVKEIVDDGISGYLVENGDIEGLYEGILKANKLDVCGIEKKYQEFTNDHIFKQWDKLFEEIKNIEPVEKQINKAQKKKKKKKKITLGKIAYKLYSVIDKNSAKEMRGNKRYKNITNKLQNSNSKKGISIIIPHFNHSDKIMDCINSLLKQDLVDYEIIVVDDGSKKEEVLTLTNIVEDFKKRKVNIMLYEKENTGLGMTRNYGIEKASKEFIFFLDSDDTLPDKVLNLMIDRAIKENLNVVIGKTKRIELDTGDSRIWYPKLAKGSRIYHDIENRENLYIDTLSTNKLYRKSIFKDYGLYFPDGLYENVFFTGLLYSKVPDLGYINKVVYNWVIYGKNVSILNNKTSNNFVERLKTRQNIWFYYPQYVKYIMFVQILRYDLMIYVQEFIYYTEMDKRIIFEQARLFVMENQQYYYQTLLGTNNDVIYLYNCLIDNDFESFKRMADVISTYYYSSRGE